MRAMVVHAGSLMAVLTMISGWASAADQAVGQSVATAPTGTSRTTQPDQFAQLRWDLSQKGQEIDLRQYKRTFHDDFKTMDIVKDDNAPGPGAVWFSPGHGAFKTNSPLRADGPFKPVDDGLRLRCPGGLVLRCSGRDDLRRRAGLVGYGGLDARLSGHGWHPHLDRRR